MMTLYLAMPVLVQFVRLDARKTVVTGADGVHGLVVPAAGDRVDAVARLSGFGVAHVRGARETAVL